MRGILLGLGWAKMVPSHLKVASQLLAQRALDMRLQVKDVSGVNRWSGHLVWALEGGSERASERAGGYATGAKAQVDSPACWRQPYMTRRDTMRCFIPGPLYNSAAEGEDANDDTMRCGRTRNGREGFILSSEIVPGPQGESSI